MEALLNIPRSIADDSYMYKMHELIIEYEGCGKNIRTVLLNINVIAKELGRPTDLIVKCMSIYTGVRAMLNDVTNRYVLMGMHVKDDLLKIIDEFIIDYVLCHYCSNPETILYVRRNKLRIKCKSCGLQALIKCKTKLDSFVHNYILDRPNINKSDMKISRIISHTIIVGHFEIPRNGYTSDSGGRATIGPSEESPGKSNGLSDSDDSDENWSVDISDTAVAIRKQSLICDCKIATTTLFS